MQVHLHYILVQGNQKMWLLKTGDPLIEVTTYAGSTVYPFTLILFLTSILAVADLLLLKL